MAQTTWGATTTTWATDPHIWRNTTFQDGVVFNNNSSVVLGYNTKYVVTADITQINFSELHEEDRVSLLSGLLDNTVGVSATYTIAKPVLAVLDSSLDNGASVIANFVGDATLSNTTGTDASSGALKPVIADMTQVIFSELNEEDAIKLASAFMGLSSGTVASANILIEVIGVLTHTQNLKNNVNYEESALLNTTASTSSVNNFLWNDTAEDTSTTWTKVADPDE